LSVVSSILAVHLACVFIGSLAKLLFSFLQVECASALKMVDVIIGKVISSMVIVWLQKSIRIPNSFMFSTKNEVM
jgi:hypothetical protein